MNPVDVYVVEVLSEPYIKYQRWWVDVLGDSYGHISKYSIMFDFPPDMEAIKKGYIFTA